MSHTSQGYKSQVLYQVRTTIKRPETVLWLPGAFKIKSQILTGLPWLSWGSFPALSHMLQIHWPLQLLKCATSSFPHRAFLYCFFCLECSPYTLCLANLCSSFGFTATSPQASLHHPTPAPSLHLNWDSLLFNLTPPLFSFMLHINLCN